MASTTARGFFFTVPYVKNSFHLFGSLILILIFHATKLKIKDCREVLLQMNNYTSFVLRKNGS